MGLEPVTPPTQQQQPSMLPQAQQDYNPLSWPMQKIIDQFPGECT